MHYMEKVKPILKTFVLIGKDDPFCRAIKAPFVMSKTLIPLGKARVKHSRYVLFPSFYGYLTQNMEKLWYFSPYLGLKS